MVGKEKKSNKLLRLARKKFKTGICYVIDAVVVVVIGSQSCWGKVHRGRECGLYFK